MKANDSLFAWGRNPNGQLGDGTLLGKTKPIAVLFLCPTSTATPFLHKIAAGWSHSLYICNNTYTVNTWGANANGQLGGQYYL